MPNQNVIYKDRDNPVVIEFTFSGEFGDGGLSNFNRIEVFVGSEMYSTDVAPQNVFIVGQELHINIGVDTDLDSGAYPIKIVGYTDYYNDGYVLTNCQRLSRVQIKD